MPRAPPSLFRNVTPEYVAVVLASSAGSRLFPITSNELPKHMMPVGGIPVLSRLLTAIEASGFQECVVVLARDDPVTMPHLKADLLNNENTNSGSCADDTMTGSYRISSSKPNVVVMESNSHMKITILTLQEECEGSIDAVRQVETIGAVPKASNMMVLPGDLVVFDPSVISNICDTHRQEGIPTVCTVLLADVGEQDEHGAPLKESAKAKKGGLARDEDDIEYIALSYSSSNAASAPRLVWKQLKADVYESQAISSETPKLKLPKPLLRMGGMTRLRTDWNDVHVYVFSPWVRRLIVERKSLLTIQGDLLPLLISRQFQGVSKTFGRQVEEEVVRDVLLTSPDLASLAGGPTDDGDGGGRPSVSQSAVANTDYDILAHVQDEAVRAQTISSYLHASREVLNQACATPEEGPTSSKPNPCLQLPPNTLVRSKFHSILLPGATTGDKVTIKSTSVGRNCKLGAKCRLNNVVLMDDVTIGNNVTLQNTIVGAKSTIGDNCSFNDCQVAPGVTVPSGEKAKGETFSD
ncbi:Translation initiation factor [Seminavis robusta]|uniref:Translation initiation factor eIF2B subunit gamma n=1 Tax=Seminavis robusta TaxID=568900 RepID=A0A9N8E1S8_9STRA|nr:Translation initiation factor [Seminavis robusta]|eukprot:Sro565_g167630.1 Translation initiation factor (524) ;mRNA; f:36375-38052